MKRMLLTVVAAGVLAAGFVPAASGDGGDGSESGTPCTTPTFPPVSVAACVEWIQAQEDALLCDQQPGSGACLALDDLYYEVDSTIYEKPPQWPETHEDIGVWDTDCNYRDLSNHDDPVKYHGQNNGSDHMHDFFANRRTNENSTSDSLVADHKQDLQPGGADVGCRDLGDGAAYWAPALYDCEPDQQGVCLPNGEDPAKKRKPKGIHAYYRSYTQTPITDFPLNTEDLIYGFGFVAGQPNRYEWACANNRDATKGPRIPACPDSRFVAIVVFPDCWNGNDPFIESNFVYRYEPDEPPTTGTCPVGWFQIPELTLVVRWQKWNGVDTTWRLSSDVANCTVGGTCGTSMHADFFNGWMNEDPEFKQKTLNDVCLDPENRNEDYDQVVWCKGDRHPMPPPPNDGT